MRNKFTELFHQHLLDLHHLMIQSHEKLASNHRHLYKMKTQDVTDIQLIYQEDLK